jgi:hypothetical protein
VLIIIGDFDGIIPQGHRCIYKVIEGYFKIPGAGEDNRLWQRLWTRPLTVALKPHCHRISRTVCADARNAVKVVQINGPIGDDYFRESLDGKILLHGALVAEQRAAPMSAFHPNQTFRLGLAQASRSAASPPWEPSFEAPQLRSGTRIKPRNSASSVR